MYYNEEGKCFNTLDEMMNDYKEKQKKRPIETKIKDSIIDFFSYIFNLFRDAFYEIKWFFQRANKGYDIINGFLMNGNAILKINSNELKEAMETQLDGSTINSWTFFLICLNN